MLYSGKNCCLGQGGCTSENVVIVGQSGCIRAKRFVFVQKWFYLGKSGCIRARVVVLGQSCCIRSKWLYSGESGCIRAKWL